MNLEERTDKSPVFKGFRHTLQIAMGILYIFLGGLIIYTRKLGSFSIDLPLSGYIGLGIVIALYGVFRIWRAWQEVKIGRMEKLRNDAMSIARH